MYLVSFYFLLIVLFVPGVDKITICSHRISILVSQTARDMGLFLFYVRFLLLSFDFQSSMYICPREHGTPTMYSNNDSMLPLKWRLGFANGDRLE